MEGLVCDIQRFSVQDGPGIRTTVFLQGCTLRCAWCHNPESIPRKPVLRYAEGLCVHCGRCEAVCPNGVHRVSGQTHQIDRALCDLNGACVSACPTGALFLSSKGMEAQAVIQTVLEDRPFYEQSGGGLTVSGGEPLLQADFAEELLRLAKGQGVHTALETAGHVPWRAFRLVLPYTDLFLFDFKVSAEAGHWIGADGQLILRNLKRLQEAGKRIILRCPIIPGVNDNAGHLRAIAELLISCPKIDSVELLAYHRLGMSKYAGIGREYTLGDVRPMEEYEKAGFLALAAKEIRHPVKWG